MVTNRSFFPLASVFIVWLCVFSTTHGNAAFSYDEKAFTQTVVAASTNPADSKNMPGPGFPISIGGGGNSNGGGGWLRIWTPFGWITIGGGGDSHGGGGGGGFQPFVPPPSPPKPNPPLQPSNSQLPPWLAPFFGGRGRQPSPPSPSKPVMPNPSNPSNPVTPNPSNPTPQHPSNPVTPNPSNPTPQHPSNPATPQHPSNPTPQHPSNPTPQHPSNPVTPNPSNPTPGSSRPPLPPWLSPFFGGGGRQPSLPSGLTPAHLAGNSMGTRSEASALETSKTSVKERHQHYQCWSPLEKTDKCVNEILTAFSSRKFEVLGSACCSAIEKMDKDCHASTIGNFHDHFFSASLHRHCSAN